MNPDDPAIAHLELTRVRTNGQRTLISVKVGPPYKTIEGAWRTPVEIHGLDDRLADIYGVDSLQSLCLAIRLVKARLESAIADGDRLVDSEDSDIPFDAYFKTF